MYSDISYLIVQYTYRFKHFCIDLECNIFQECTDGILHSGHILVRDTLTWGCIYLKKITDSSDVSSLRAQINIYKCRPISDSIKSLFKGKCVVIRQVTYACYTTTSILQNHTFPHKSVYLCVYLNMSSADGTLPNTSYLLNC